MTTSGVLEAAVCAARKASSERFSHKPTRWAIQRRAQAVQPRQHALADALVQPGLRVIAECKRRSPSRGVLRREYDPAAIALAYARAGAAAISVLTEPTFFDGSLEHLAAVRAAVDLPLLRKDFITSEFQLDEARAAGADSVLLIAAALPEHSLMKMILAAHVRGLGVLVEVHDVAELRRVVELQRSPDMEAIVIGVNCRDLRSLTVDPGVFETLARECPAGIGAVAESGIRAPADVSKLAGLGYRGFLIGERFMTEPNPGASLESFLRDAREIAR